MSKTSRIKTFWVLGLLILAAGGLAVFKSEDPLVEAITEEAISDVFVYEGDEPVYVTLYSHNEDTWKSMVDSEKKYLDYRAGLVDRAELLAEYGIEWNWQSDLPVIEAVMEYDKEGAPFMNATDGENVLVYIESLGASLDPHVHTNNMADIVYLMQELGGSPSGVIGGALYAECGKEYLGFLDMVSWRDEMHLDEESTITGELYPDFKWKPTIFSGPAFGGHWFDDWTSGIWSPGDEDAFYEHDSDSGIVYVGQGYPHDISLIGAEHASGALTHYEGGDYIKELVEKITTGELPTGTESGDRYMYTASLHFRDTTIVRDGESNVDTVQGLRTVLDALEPLREAGLIVYVDYEQAVEIWKTEYDSEPNQLSLESFSVYDDVKSQAMEYCEGIAR